jgi:hypothetical protein
VADMPQAVAFVSITNDVVEAAQGNLVIGVT